MGIFSATKPVITKNEADIIKNRLANEHGWDSKKLAIADQMLKPHLEDAEQYGDPVGVSPKEVQEIDEQLDKGDTKHIYSVKLSEPDVDAFEKLLKDYLVLRK